MADKIIAKIDYDFNLGYEQNNFFKKIINFFLISFLNFLPTSFQRLIKRSNKSAKEVIEKKTTHDALEILYDDKGIKNSKKILQKIFYLIWFKTNNAKAVRNRLRLAKREIKTKLNYFLKKDKSVNMLSIASGSARAILEVLYDLREEGQDISRISVIFLDKNEKALSYSQNLAKKMNLNECDFRWVNDTARSYLRKTGNNKFDIIEMVGLLDYFDDKKTTSVCEAIFNCLKEEGVLITANINDNRERPFVTKVIGWNMIYRSAEHLGRLILKSGFEVEEMCLYYEPLKIHCVIVAGK